MRTIKLLLTIAGCGALFVGVALAAIATSPLLTTTPSDSTSAHHTNYVVLGTCVICHESSERQWNQAASARIVENAIQNPRASEIAMNADSSSVSSMNRSASLLWGHALIDVNYQQQYVLLTEAGYQVLPDRWRIDDLWDFAPSSKDEANSSATCSDCHGNESSALFQASAVRDPSAVPLSASSVLQPPARITFITEEQIL